MKAENKDTALSAKLRLAAEKMPADMHERLRHRIVSQLDKAGPRPVTQWRVAVVQLAAILVVAMTLLGGTAYAISRSQPGDLLYPVKESFARIGLVSPSGGQLLEEPVQRRVAPEPDPEPAEREEEPRETEKRYEERDAPDAPGKPASEEAGRDDADRRDSSEDSDEVDSGKDSDETAPVRGRGQESEEGDETEYLDDSSDESLEYPCANRESRNDSREPKEE